MSFAVDETCVAGGDAMSFAVKKNPARAEVTG